MKCEHASQERFPVNKLVLLVNLVIVIRIARVRQAAEVTGRLWMACDGNVQSLVMPRRYRKVVTARGKSG